MAHPSLGEAVPAIDADDEERHGCCCVHVVSEVDAMPAADEERYRIARERYYACPHHELTPLEVWLGINWNWTTGRPGHPWQ